jgi:hypothetical protein
MAQAFCSFSLLPLLKNMVQGLPNFKVGKIGVPKGCTLCKHSKTTFPSSEQRSTEILELIHSDVCGPMSSPSYTLYYVSFIDDSSHKCCIYFMKTKDQVFSKFKEIRVLVENQREKQIKVLKIKQWTRVHLQ